MLLLPDAVALMTLVGTLAAEKREPRPRRLHLLNHLLTALPASAAAAFILKDLRPDAPPIIAGLTEAGFRAGSPAHAAFLQEFNHAPFQDAFSRAALARLLESPAAALLTFHRPDLVDDAAWRADIHVHAYRDPANLGDALLSLFRPDPSLQPPADSSAYALLLFRAPDEPPFAPRERDLLHAAHAGLEWMYREEAARNPGFTDDLPRRLRETLRHLLTGASERQIARQMKLSPHTVHDYVKALYTRFAVSSRQELIAWWTARGHPLPLKHD
jgi:DNA-binding NarL/FixJ family response regulator